MKHSVCHPGRSELERARESKDLASRSADCAQLVMRPDVSIATPVSTILSVRTQPSESFAWSGSFRARKGRFHLFCSVRGKHLCRKSNRTWGVAETSAWRDLPYSKLYLRDYF